MKKLILFLLLAVSLLVAGTWSESGKPIIERSGYSSYSFVATFTALDTLTSSVFQIEGRDRDISWVTFPFYTDIQVDTLAAASAAVTIYLLGGFDVVDVACDTITLSAVTADSTNYQTFDLNDKKFPNYKLQMIADSCTVDFQFY